MRIEIYILFSYKIECVEYRIPKFELYRVKIDDFTSAESLIYFEPEWSGDCIEFIAKFPLVSLCWD